MASIPLASRTSIMNQLDIIQSLGKDVVLLTRPDNWLEQRKHIVSEQLSIFIEEMKALESATDIKRRMQDKNLVAIKHWKDIDGLPDEVIEIMELPEAIKVLANDEHAYDSCGQINVWKADGYDIETATQLRAS